MNLACLLALALPFGSLAAPASAVSVSGTDACITVPVVAQATTPPAPAGPAAAKPAAAAARPAGASTPAAPATTNPAPVAAADAADPARVEDIVARVQATYDAVRDFNATFSQEFTNRALGETRTSTGHVWFRKPGMMRWDYRTPSERFLISDGRNLWVYEAEFGQYWAEPLADNQLPTALRFLMGEGRLTDDFQVSLHGSSTAERVVLELVPKQKSNAYQKLHFVVSPQTWQVVETIVIDPLGNRNRIAFSGVKTNAGLPESGFTFTAPEGAVRIERPK